ncbi:fatty acyl-AMP ligase [Mycolicibacterium arseniciresistens]|uniref:Fatty acyl-AMP ligase n=1 Tax=Mycolicibacterium arseniciresistens TaxID=3062257 RepID=A0ABT8UEC2_9MYCO|nr:fatty acyl-AMP ligase [Mycolicibacterium arseniciresistens]MDO3635516.1 fatty acyl-AMP ligase [Mycolicibacterium arseniciresistens]
MRTSHTTDLVSHLRSQFEAHPADRCFTFLNESGRHLVPEVTTFADLDRDGRELAAWLSSQPEAERPVLLLFEPGIDFWRAFLGCLYAGVIAIPTPLPVDQRSMKRVAGILRDADSGLALTTEKLRGLFTAGIDELDLAGPLRCVATDDRPLADADSWTMPDLTADTVAFLQYTSGSTGDPKGVAVTHGNVVHNETAMTQAVRAHTASVMVGWIPHWHDMGLMGQMLAFFNGADLVTMSPLAFLKQPVRLLTAISDHRGTMTAAPNFAYDLIARRVAPDQLTGLDLSCWQVALNGAEPVRRRTIERITDLLAPAGFAPSSMRPAYGMAEVTLMATFSSDGPRHLDADVDALEQHRYVPATGRAVTLVSSGPPAPGVEVRIVDPETSHPLPEDAVGEIWLRSPSVASGYHRRPVQTAEQFRAETADGEGPYLRTGDLGLLHDGELFVTGRLKDLLIANGRNLYPQDIEEFVQDVHPAVAGSRGCAVAVDVDDAERLVLIQAIKTELLGDTSCAELAAAVRTAVARGFEIPAPGVVFVERGGIHLTTSGKVQRASMRDAFLKGELTDIVYEERPR